MPRQRKELWEDLDVVWLDANDGKWYLTRVINHNASENKSAFRYVTYSEIIDSLFRTDVIFAKSKQEAILKYAVSGRSGIVWRVSGDNPVLSSTYVTWNFQYNYRLEKEESL